VITLSPDQLVQIGATTDDEAAQARDGLIEAYPSYTGGTREMFEDWRRGKIGSTTISVQGVRSYVIFWRVEVGKCLAVLGVFALPGGKQSFADIVEGCEQIGIEQGCTSALVLSSRKGYARQAAAFGGQPISVAYSFPNRKCQGMCRQGKHD
jgi:hypothetical protein